MKVPPAWQEKCKFTPTGPRDRIRVDLWKTDLITIPIGVRTELEKWKADPSSFFIVTVTTAPSKDPFTRLARLLYNTSGGDQAIGNIRTRIGCIGLHRLKANLGLHRLQSDTDADSEFRQRIQSQCEIQPKALSKLLSLGARCDSLSTDLAGLGSMISWPEDISTAK